MTQQQKNNGAACPNLTQTQQCTPPTPTVNAQRIAYNGQQKFWSCEGGICDKHGSRLYIYDKGGTAGPNGGQIITYNPNSATFVSNNNCLDVVNSRTANGSQTQFFACNGSAAQQWYWQWNAGAQAWNIVHAQSGRCLDLPNGNTTNNGAQLQLFDCNGLPNQKWYPSNA